MLIRLTHFLLSCSYILGMVITEFDRKPTLNEWIAAILLILIQILILNLLLRRKFNNNVKLTWVLSIICTFYVYSYDQILFELADFNVFLAHFIYFLFIPFIFYLSRKYIDKPLIRTSQFLNIGLLFYGFLGIFSIQRKLEGFSTKKNLIANIPILDSIKHKSNIYLFILDAYSGEKTLKENFGFINTPFIDSLQNKGFVYFSDSKSDYNSTIYSMSSFFMQDTLPEALCENTSKKDNRRKLSQLIDTLREKNKFLSKLEKQNYFIYNFSIFNLNGYYPIYHRISYNEWNSFWIFSLEKTFYGKFFIKIMNWHWIRNYFYEPERIEREIFNQTDSIARLVSTQPKFIYVHSLAVHGPLFYINENNYNNSFIDFIFNDSDITDSDGEKKYIKAIKSLNDRLLTTINNIIYYDKKATILILSDHGYKGYNDSRVYSNLMAIYSKDLRKEELRNIQTPFQISKYLTELGISQNF